MYKGKHTLFTYRNENKVLSFCFTAETLLVSLPDRLVEWSRMERRAIREFKVENEVMDIKDWNGMWVLFSRNMVETLINGDIQKITPRKPLSTLLIYENDLLMIDDKELTIASFVDGDIRVRKVGLISSNGVCSCGLSRNKELFLSFENGKVFRIREAFMREIMSGRVKDLIVDKLECLLFLKEPIVAIDTLEEMLVVSLFNGKVLTLNLHKEEVVFTELLYEIKRSLVWMNFITVSDRENNIIFMDRGLNIVGSGSFNEEICGIASDDSTLAVGFRSGAIKEYSSEIIRSLGFMQAEHEQK